MAKLKRDRPEPRAGKGARMVCFRVSAAEHQVLTDIAKANDLTLADLLRVALDDWIARRKGRKPR